MDALDAYADTDYADYDYYFAVYDDIWHAIQRDFDLKDFATFDELKEDIVNSYDSDEFTGYADKTYTGDPRKAIGCLSHNFDILSYALKDLGWGTDALEEGPEWCDVLCRVYVFPDAFERVLEDLEVEWEEARDTAAKETGTVSEAEADDEMEM